MKILKNKLVLGLASIIVLILTKFSYSKIREYNILKDNGKIKREIADKLALDEYKKYRVIQDQNYISDFDELVIETKKLNNK